MPECTVASNSFVEVIVIKTSETMSDLEAINIAIDLLKEEKTK